MKSGERRVKQIKSDLDNYHVFSYIQGLDLFKGCKSGRGTTYGRGKDSKSRERDKSP